MEHLCHVTRVNGSLSSWVSSTCHCDWVIVFTALFSTYITMLLIAYLGWMVNDGECRRRKRPFVNHSVRACLVIALLLTTWAEFADAFLSAASSHIFAVPLASLTLLIPLTALEHLIEKTNQPRLLLVSGFIFLACGSTRSLRFAVLRHLDVPVDRLRPVTAAVSSVACLLLSAFEFLTARKEMRREQEMEERDGHGYRHDDAHFFSKATFFWMNSLLRSGYKSPMELEDLGTLPRSHSARELHQQLENVMPLNEKMTSRALARLFWRFMRNEFLIGGIFKFLGDLVGVVGPLGISAMVEFVADRSRHPDESRPGYPEVRELWQNGWSTAFVVLFASIAQSTFSQASTHFVNVKSIHLKVALQSLMYKKSLRLRASKISHNAKQGSDRKVDDENLDFGVVINLFSNDSTNIMSFFWIAHYIWAIPVKISVILFLLYKQLGTSAIVGALAIITLLIPLQLFLGRKMSRNTSAVLELSDERLHHLSTLTDKMKLFKLLGWEKHYCDKILAVRRRELDFLDRDSVLVAMLTFFTHASSVLVSLITFGAHYVLGNVSLTPESVFSALALFNQMMVPLVIFPVIIPIIAQAAVSCRRISEFLNSPEMKIEHETKTDINDEPASKTRPTIHKMTSINEEDESRIATSAISSCQYTCRVSQACDDGGAATGHQDGDSLQCFRGTESDENNHSSADGNEDDGFVLIENGVFSWSPELGQKHLEVEYLKIPFGKVILVIGKVGSGKTSLLSAILGEMSRTSGTLKRSGELSMAYCPQTPWLMKATIRDNILFGLPYRPRRYGQVLGACALKSDLDILPKKDLTEIGESGINLSGGQKQRISIARALYSNANLVILDDSLSSLDLSTAFRIFENGIKKSVRKSKRTVVLATHNHQFLKDSCLIVVVDDGRIKVQGRLEEIALSDPELSRTFTDFAFASKAVPKEHTAKERWQLIKAAARIRRSGARNVLAYEVSEGSESLRRRVDQCRSTDNGGDFDASRKRLRRASSLQDRNTKVSRIVRQHSTPITTDSKRKHQKRSITEMHSRKTSVSLIYKDNCKAPLCRVVSSETEFSDVFMEFEVEAGDPRESVVGVDTDDREYGELRTKIYWTYLDACGAKTSLAYAMSTLAWQVVRVSTDYCLSLWIETPEADGMIKYLSVYASLSIGAILLSLTSHGLGQLAGSHARRKLHDSMLLNVVRCPDKIFAGIPAGRIFNRFSADVDVIDKKLAPTIQRLMQFLLLCCSAIVINAVITPWFVVVAVPLVLLYYMIQRFYRCSSRELQRLDSITRSPIFSHFSETLSGLASIRAFGYEDRFVSSFHAKLNLNTNCFLILNPTHRWLGIVLDYLGGLIVFLAMMAALIAVKFCPESITPSLVGLAMNYTLLVPIYLNWVVKFLADCEIYLGAVERVKQYTNLPVEEYAPPTADVIPPDWPQHGDIKFENVSLSYGSATELVLSGINLHIPPGQKIGICGRSGSGKTSLALSLFNMLEIQGGAIKIDDIDITKVPLALLRSRGSIIPQDTLLFNGSVRENLDATGTIADDRLWAAVNEAQLKEIIDTEYGGDLDAETNAGQHLSGGQKQLFSLARAILQKSSFLIMDEATSNLDKECEQMLMATAQKIFTGKTLLIIAHRLSTVLNCDRIIVLDKGRIMEDGTPSCLMNKEHGLFSSMVKSSEEGFLTP